VLQGEGFAGIHGVLGSRPDRVPHGVQAQIRAGVRVRAAEQTEQVLAGDAVGYVLRIDLRRLDGAGDRQRRGVGHIGVLAADLRRAADPQGHFANVLAIGQAQSGGLDGGLDDGRLAEESGQFHGQVSGQGRACNTRRRRMPRSRVSPAGGWLVRTPCVRRRSACWGARLHLPKITDTHTVQAGHRKSIGKNEKSKKFRRLSESPMETRVARDCERRTRHNARE